MVARQTATCARRVTRSEVVVALLTLAALVSSMFLAHTPSAKAAPVRPLSSYNCVTAPEFSSGHCYGHMYWNGAIYGSFQQIQVEPLTSPGGISGAFIDEEAWLDSTSTGVWSEAGYTTNGSPTYYFWGGYNTNTGIVDFHPFAQVPSGDRNGYLTVTMRHESNGTVNIFLTSPSYEWFPFTEDSSFSANQFKLGSELFGYSGGSAYWTNFQYIGWINSSGQEIYEGANPGVQNNQPPENAGVNVWSSNSSTGGSYYSYCGC